MERLQHTSMEDRDPGAVGGVGWGGGFSSSVFFPKPTQHRLPGAGEEASHRELGLSQKMPHLGKLPSIAARD